MSNEEGWVKIHRKVMRKGFWKNSFYAHLWMHILMKANSVATEVLWNGKTVMLEPGQFITGRNALALETGISPSSVERALATFELEGQIGQQKTNKFRLITVKNWGSYQVSRTTDGQQTDNKRTTDGHKQEDKNLRIQERDHITPPPPPSGLPAAAVEDPKPRKAAPHAEVVQHFFDLKGWKAEGPEFRRYLRAGKDLLEVCGGDVGLARKKLGKVRDWADRKELSWSLETVLKRWHEIDAPERPERKRATIDGDRAYLNERGDWMIIPRDGGPHLLYAGPLSAIRYD